MVRKTLLTCLVSCLCAISHAEETKTDKEASKSKSTTVSVLKQADTKTLATDDGTSKLKRAVHVNASGITGRSEPRRSLGAAGRLRSVRESVILPPPSKTAKPATTDKSARPAKPADTKTSKPVAAKSAGGAKLAPSQNAAKTNQVAPRPAPKNAAPSVEPKVLGQDKALTSRRVKAPPAKPVLPSNNDLDISIDASGKPVVPTPTVEPAPARKVLPSVVTRRTAPSAETAPVTTESAAGTNPVASLPNTTTPPAAAAPSGDPGQAEPRIARSDAGVNTPTLAVPELAAPPRATTSQPTAVADVPSTLEAAPHRPAPMKLLDITPVEVGETAIRTNPTRTTENPRVASRPLGPGTQAREEISTEPMKLDAIQPSRNLNLDDRARAAEPARLGARPAPSQSPALRPKREADANGDVLLANRSPVLIIKTHGQPTIRVGRAASYFVTAENSGDLSAEDVVVSVNVPSWAELARNQASTGLVRVEPSSNGDNVLKWSIRDLQPGARQKLRIDMIPRASRPIELGVTWNFKSVSAMAQIEVQEAKLKMSVVGPSDIQYGETKLYTINISNPGTGDAENVVLTLLPITDGTEHAGVRELGDIKAGTRRTVEVELTARQAGDLAVRAKATADGGLVSQGEQKVRVRRAQLTVEAVGPSKRYAGTSGRYAIKIMNQGDATARDVITTVSLPLAAKYVKSSGGGVYDGERGKVRWNIGALRPGAFQIVELTTTLMGAGTNRLEVRSSGGGHLSAVGAVQTEVEALADLKLYVDDPTGVVPIGTEVEYQVRIVNRGTRAAHNVDVIGYFSEGIEPVSVQGWKGAVEVGQVSLDTIPRIAPGQEIVVKVLAKADRVGDHVFRAEVHAKDPATKLAVDEWTRFDQGDEVRTLDGSGLEQAKETSDELHR